MKEKVNGILTDLRDANGVNLFESKMISSINVDKDATKIEIKLNLTKDYRKVKQLIEQKLKE